MHQSPFSTLLIQLSLLLVLIIISSSEAKTTSFIETKLAYSEPYGSVSWSDATIWDNGVPAAGDTVLIPNVLPNNLQGTGRGTLDIGSAQISIASFLFDDGRIKLIGTGKLTVTNNVTLGIGSIGCPFELGQSGTMVTLPGGGWIDGTSVTIRGSLSVTSTIIFIPPVQFTIETTGTATIVSTYSDVAIGNPRDDNGNSVITNKGTVFINESITDSFYYSVGLCSKVINSGTIRILAGQGTIGTCYFGTTTYNIVLSGSFIINTGAELYLPNSIYTVDPALSLSGAGWISLNGGYGIADNATLTLNNPLNFQTGGIKTDKNVRIIGDSNLNLGKLLLTNYYVAASTTGVINVASLEISGTVSPCDINTPDGLQCALLRKIVAQNFTVLSEMELTGGGHLYLTGFGTINADIGATDNLKQGTLTVAPGADLLIVGCCRDIDATFYMNGTTRTEWTFRDGTEPTFTGSYVRFAGKGVSSGTWIAEGYPRDRTGNMGDFTFSGNSANGAYWQFEAGTKFIGFGYSRLDSAVGVTGSSTSTIQAASTHVFNTNVVAENFAFGEDAFVTGTGSITVTGSFGNIVVNPKHTSFIGTGARKLALTRFSGGTGFDIDGPEVTISESAVFTGAIQLLKATSVVTLLPGSNSWLEYSGFAEADSAGYLLVQGNLTLDSNGNSLAYARTGGVTIVVGGTGVLKTNNDIVTNCIATVFGSTSGQKCTCNATSPWCYSTCNPATQCDTMLNIQPSTTHRSTNIEHYGPITMWGNAHLEVHMYDSKAIDANPDSDNSPEWGGDYITLGRFGDDVGTCQLSGTLTVNFVGTPGLPGQSDTPVDVPSGSRWRFMYVYGTKCAGGFNTVVGNGLPSGYVLGVVIKTFKSTQNSQVYAMYYAKACPSSDSSCKSEYEAPTALTKDFVKGTDKPCPQCTTTGTTSSSPSSSTSASSSTQTSSDSTSTTGGSPQTNCVSITGKTVCLGGGQSQLSSSLMLAVLLFLVVLVLLQ